MAEVAEHAPLQHAVVAEIRARTLALVLIVAFAATGDALTRVPGVAGMSASAVTSLGLGFFLSLAALAGWGRALSLPAAGRRLCTYWFSHLLLLMATSAVRLPPEEATWSLSLTVQQSWAWVFYGAAIIAVYSLLSPLREHNLERSIRGLASSIALVGVTLAVIVLTAVLVPAVGALGIVGYRPIAAVLALCGIAAIFLVKSPIRRWAAVSLMLAALMASGSRTATVALVIGGVAGSLGTVSVARPSSWPRLLGALLLIGIIGIGFSLTSFGSRLGELVLGASSIASDPLSGESAYLTAGRAVAWPQIFSHALENWVFGRGAGSASAFTAAVTGHARFPHPHNEYLRIFHDTGAVGLALFLAVFAELALYRHRASRTAPDAPLLFTQLRTTVRSSTLAVLLLFVTDNIGFYTFVMAVHALFAGALLAFDARYQAR